MSDTDQVPGGYGPSIFFNDAERAFVSCLVLRGPVQAELNDDEPFPCYRPISYRATEGTRYNIVVQVSDPGLNPPPHVFPDMIEMDVYWGPQPAIPELTDAVRLLQESSETQGQTSDKSGGSPGDSVDFDNINRAVSACLAVRGQVEKKLKSKSFPNYKPISYQAQVVEGTNYKIRVDVSEPWGKWPDRAGIGPVRLRTIVEMTVYWGLGAATPEVTDVKIENEPLEYFENEGEGRRKKALGGGGYGETVFFNRDPETERAYLSSFALRGQVEEKLNKGKPFPSYKPFCYQAEMLWLEGMNFKILIDITPPPNWPPVPFDAIGPLFPQTLSFVEITVYLGPIPIPELKAAKIVKPNNM